jgi:hypothetical protein
MRFHKNSERYDKDITGELKERDATKIKYIITKINKVMNMYSNIYEKNQKLKLDAMNLFFKALEYKDAVLYNDFEEVKIVNKLSFSENTADLDYLVDLENMRTYAYMNYKDFSRDGFRLRTTLPVQGIRHTNIKYKNKTENNKKRKIELRVGHTDLPLNVIGIIFNPNKKEVLENYGGFKSSMKLTFVYEFLLRMTYNSVKIMTIPKIGYKHINMRPESIFWDYKNGSNKLSENEVKFWVSAAKKEYFFTSDRNIKFAEENA